MKHIRIALLPTLLLGSIVISQRATGKPLVSHLDSLKEAGKTIRDASRASSAKLGSLLGIYTYTDSFDREYALDDLASLTVRNTEGNIVIKPGQHKNAIILHAKRRSNNKESLANITIQESSIRKNESAHLNLTSIYTGEKTKGAIDYELEIPAHIALNLCTLDGTISIERTEGKILANTTHGKINLQDIVGNAIVQVKSKGDINLSKPHGDVKAVTSNGNIKIHDARKSIVAATDDGNIHADLARFSKNGFLELNAQGNITVALPADVSAHVRGNTKRGSFTSAHWITVNSFTTQLNRNAWTQFKRSIEGVIGQGDAQIKLSSVSGNIKLVEAATT